MSNEQSQTGLTGGHVPSYETGGPKETLSPGNPPIQPQCQGSMRAGDCTHENLLASHEQERIRHLRLSISRDIHRILYESMIDLESPTTITGIPDNKRFNHSSLSTFAVDAADALLIALKEIVPTDSPK